MTRNPKKIKLKASLSEAEELFNLYKINSLVVADENDNTMGVIQIYNL
jgi:CBS domain-containing protein